MKDEAKKVVAKVRGMGLIEAAKISVPKKMRRAAWPAGNFIFWQIGENSDDDNFYLNDSHDEPYHLTDADIMATDWEIKA